MVRRLIYVDKESAIRDIIKTSVEYFLDSTSVAACIGILDKHSSCDAEEVVRCKDCIHLDKGENDSECWCECTAHFGRYFAVSDDDYCSFGTKKNSEDRDGTGYS